jgi:hypothetical protein
MVPNKQNGAIVYTPREVYHDTDFNSLDFGELASETEIEPVKRTTVDDVMQEAIASGKFSTSVSGSFVAQHRQRPLTKIIFSNAPDGEGIDGFHTRILNISNSNADPEQELMNKLHQLICDFIEGKASVKNIGNENFAFVDLTDSVVDCTGNEYGGGSMFEMLRCYTPIGFLEDLALRLMSIYAIDVAVVEGRGLVLRHEAKKS